jgi:hypothetical protein
VNMMFEIQKGTLLALHIGRMKNEGTSRPITPRRRAQ